MNSDEKINRIKIDETLDEALDLLGLGSGKEGGSEFNRRDSDELRRAYRLIEKALAMDSRYSRAYYVRGFYSVAGRHLMNPETDFRKPIELDKGEMEGYTGLATLFVKEPNRKEDAGVVLRDAVKYARDKDSAYRHLGEFLLNERRVKEAEIVFRMSLEYDPGDFWTLNDHATALNYLNRFADAEAVFREALEIHPADVGFHINLGALLSNSKRYEEAEELLKEALRHDSRDGRIYHSLKMKQGRFRARLSS